MLMQIFDKPTSLLFTFSSLLCSSLFIVLHYVNLLTVVRVHLLFEILALLVPSTGLYLTCVTMSKSTIAFMQFVKMYRIEMG